MSRRLFVYGSLKKGQIHHERMQSAAFESAMRTASGFRLVRYGPYPALVNGGSGSVHGEVYRVSAELLAELDDFEGCPDSYRRTIVVLEDGSRVETYCIDEERGARFVEIPDGCWLG